MNYNNNIKESNKTSPRNSFGLGESGQVLIEKRNQNGDVEHQLQTLSNNVGQLEKIVEDLVNRINPVLLPQVIADSNEKEGYPYKEESISPLASDVRHSNNKLDYIKNKILDTLERVQL